MDPHPTTSRDSGNCFASACAAVSRSLGRLTHDWRDEPMSDGGHLSYDQPDFEFPGTMVEIFPSDAVERHALSWRGMATETVKATEPAESKFDFVHRFICSSCSRKGHARRGHLRRRIAVVRGPELQGKLVFVPSGHEYYDW
jgi:hypothetical protein